MDNANSSKLCFSLENNIKKVRELTHSTSDLMVNRIEICGIKCGMLSCEGMVSTQMASILIFHPLMNIAFEKNPTPTELYNHLNRKMFMTFDRVNLFDFENLLRFMMSGFVIILLDGYDVGFCLGIQGYDKRGVSEPTTEANILGSQDGFVETIRSNFSLIRRRMKTGNLKIQLMQVGTASKTDIALVYMTNKVSPNLIAKIKSDLEKINLEMVLNTGYLEPFLEGRTLSIFSNLTYTQRPDVMCGKVNEGRVGILVDGTPFALVVPVLFSENFQTIDDYAQRPYYATYIRLIKYIGFFLAIYLPAVYVAVASFHPEMFSRMLLIHLSSAMQITPFTLFTETVIIIILFEIIKEAGIRLPKVVGGAISIVGGLVIGDAAVQSGLISTPLLIIVGITATTAFVIPTLNPQISFLRLGFLILGGAFGLFGIGIGTALLIFNICGMETYGVPFTAPFSPFSKSIFTDVLIRIGYKRMEKVPSQIDKLNGVDEIK